MKKRRLKWYGNVTRTTGLAKNPARNSARKEKERKTEEEMRG